MLNLSLLSTSSADLTNPTRSSLPPCSNLVSVLLQLWAPHWFRHGRGVGLLLLIPNEGILLLGVKLLERAHPEGKQWEKQFYGGELPRVDPEEPKPESGLVLMLIYLPYCQL